MRIWMSQKKGHRNASRPSGQPIHQTPAHRPTGLRSLGLRKIRLKGEVDFIPKREFLGFLEA